MGQCARTDTAGETDNSLHIVVNVCVRMCACARVCVHKFNVQATRAYFWTPCSTDTFEENRPRFTYRPISQFLSLFLSVSRSLSKLSL